MVINRNPRRSQRRLVPGFLGALSLALRPRLRRFQRLLPPTRLEASPTAIHPRRQMNA